MSDDGSLHRDMLHWLTNIVFGVVFDCNTSFVFGVQAIFMKPFVYI